MLKHSLAIGAAVLVVGMHASVASAQDFNPNKKTYLTFSAPVEVPGATLQPGKYLFQLADLQSNRHVVQIFNEDGTKLIVTTLTIPDQRMDPADEPVVQFLETPAGTPAAIKSWFYPGNTIGDEFIYPKEQAMRIARATNQTVLSSDTISGDGIPGMKADNVARIGADGTAATGATAEQPQTPAPAPTPAPQATTPPTPAPEAAAPAPRETPEQTAPVGTSGRSELPRTASNMPLIALIGLLSLVSALSVRMLARNRG